MKRTGSGMSGRARRLRALACLPGLVFGSVGAGPALAAGGEPPPEKETELVVFSKLLADASAVPAIAGTGVGVGLGLPLTVLGYPEATQPISSEVLPAVGSAANGMNPVYQPALGVAEAPAGTLAPTVNPTARPLLRAFGRKVAEEAPAAGTDPTFNHFGVGGKQKTIEQPSAEPDELNFTTKIRAVPIRFLVQLPTEVEVAIPEAVVGTGNGYGAAVAQVNPGFLPAALMWSALGFWGGTLVPHPGYVQSNFPTGPSEDNKPILSGTQAEDVATWGWFRSRVDGKGNDRGSVEGAKLSIPGVLSVGSLESISEATNHGDRIGGQALSLLKDVKIADVITIDAVKTASSAEGNGTPEGRKTAQSVSLMGMRVADVPVVLTGEGVTLAGADALPKSERATREAQVNEALKSAGITLRAVPAQSADSVSDSGSTAAIAVAGLRITFNRPDRPQLYQIDLGYAEASVFTGQRLDDPFGLRPDGSPTGDGSGLDYGSGSTAAAYEPGSGSVIPVDMAPAEGVVSSLANGGFAEASKAISDGGLPGVAATTGRRADPGGTVPPTGEAPPSSTEFAGWPTRLPAATLAGRLGSLYRGTALLALAGLMVAPFLVRRVLLRTPQN